MMLNRDVFQDDPTQTKIPNDGVAKVLDPRTPEEWEVLQYELKSFVCEGEYRRGLEQILSTYLTNLSRADQPAVWVSGFYGSGKSHLVRVLEYLWRDVAFPDGARARGLATLPGEIDALLKELSTQARREGGLWSAAGTLGAGAGNSVRLALLAILLHSAGLPEQYAPARFVIWLQQRGYDDTVRATIEAEGESLDQELNNMYVSPVLAGALLKAYPDFAADAKEARSLLKTQFPPESDISDDELLRMMEDVLALKSTTHGKLPLTLLIFDELQQFIGEDSTRTLQVQNVVEACTSRFGSRLLFIATGQASLQATPQLSKLQGRFTVPVMLSDKDVEQVVREVVLRKKPSAAPELKSVLDAVSGEIDRHLAGTKIGASFSDAPDLVPDYPLLPVRRRFWERVLRAVDSAGTTGQLRTQLRIVHDATAAVALRPLGTVVPADVIFGQLKTYMLQSSVLLRDTDTTIQEQDDATPDGRLRSRICATTFLIGKLPLDGVNITGIHATADTLADLLVEDLTVGSTDLRRRIPELLQGLVDQGTLMLVGDEYRLQTRESAEWEADYRGRYARISADDSRIASDRDKELRDAITVALKGMTLTQGESKTPRKYDLHFGMDLPPSGTGAVPVWVRDGWTISERVVRDEAQAATTASPIVSIFLPSRDADALKAALAGHAAAQECLTARPIPSTAEGAEARQAMHSRVYLERRKIDALIAGVVSNALVFLGGSYEPVAGGATLQVTVKEAIEAALVRLFPRFPQANKSGWGTVVTRATQGASDALAAVGYHGDVEKHPVCAEVRTFVGVTGKRGLEVRKRFMGDGYGWPQDAVDGALLVLVANGFVRAARNAQPLAVKEIVQSQIGVVDFYSEGVPPPTTSERIAVRGMISTMGLPVKPNEEAAAIPVALQRLAELAALAGGEPPLPQSPSIAYVKELQNLSGNAQFKAVHDKREGLLADFKGWTRAGQDIEARRPRWDTLQRLLRHAKGLPVATEVGPQVEAITAERSLLADPDPVPPLLGTLAGALRAQLQSNWQRLRDTRDQAVRDLTSSDAWRELSDDEWQRIFSTNGLGPIQPLDVGTDDALLSTLDATPLSDWDDKVAALPERLTRARTEAATIVATRHGGPKAVILRPPAATLKTEEDVDTYLGTLRASIMTHITANTPVIL